MGKLVKDMTHDDIGDFAAQWLKTHDFPVALSNCTDPMSGEQPDVLGINIYGESILGEVKVSKSDFLKDQSKPCRQEPDRGIGDYRVYITPKDLLKPEDIPYGWMLWEVHGKTKPIMKIIKGKKKVKLSKELSGYSFTTTKKEFVNTTIEEYNHFYKKDKNYIKELNWLIKVCRRIEERGINLSDFSNNYQMK